MSIPDFDLTPTPPPRVLVTGASGFIGRSACAALVQAGWRVTGLVRKIPSVPQTGVDYTLGDVLKPDVGNVNEHGPCIACVHLVGIITEIKSQNQTFEAVHVQGTQNIVRAIGRAAQDNPAFRRFVYMSAQGAGLHSPSEYSRTKAQAEQVVMQSGLPYTVFRPSLVLGSGGDFVQQMEQLIKKPPLSPFAMPFVPVPGSGDNKFQPLFVGDLCAAIVACLSRPESAAQTFEIGGATVVTFNALLQGFQTHLHTHKPLLHAPLPLMFLAASVLQAVLPAPPITTDQLTNLKSDNVCDNAAVERVLGVSPLSFEAILSRVYPAA